MLALLPGALPSYQLHAPRGIARAPVLERSRPPALFFDFFKSKDDDSEEEDAPSDAEVKYLQAEKLKLKVRILRGYRCTAAHGAQLSPHPP